MTSTEPLTEREQQALEHMRKAQELGTTLKEYASRFGLEVQHLYQMRKPLVRKGALGPAWGKAQEPPKADKSSAFLPVRIVPSVSAAGSPAVGCRLMHPSGWVLECGGLPPACWVATIMAGGAHAAT
jgi:hypothetical protein